MAKIAGWLRAWYFRLELFGGLMAWFRPTHEAGDRLDVRTAWEVASVMWRAKP